MDCVALDDVDWLDDAGADRGVRSLQRAAREAAARCWHAAAAPPVQLTLREDLVTRLAWGLVYQVHALTDEEKARALADHAAGRGFQLLPGGLRLPADARASRDLPSLLATLDALDRYSLETKRPVTVPLARELLLAAERRAGDAERHAGVTDRGSRLERAAGPVRSRQHAARGDSDFEWAQFLIEQGVLDREVYEARNQEFYDQYKAGTLDIHEFLDFQLKPLSRHPRAQLDAWHREFMERKIRPMIRAQGARAGRAATAATCAP